MKIRVVLAPMTQDELRLLLRACKRRILRITNEKKFRLLFQEVVRRYALKVVSNGKTRSAKATLKNEHGAMELYLTCACTDGYGCTCDTESNLDFYYSAMYDGEEKGNTEIPIKLRFKNDRERKLCIVSWVL